jgi:hypothetical protein
MYKWLHLFAAIAAALLVLIAALGVGVSLPDLWGLALMGLGGLFLWWLAGKAAEPEDTSFLQRVMVATVGLRMAWSFTQHKILGQYYQGIFGEDTVVRFNSSADGAAAWHAGTWIPTLPATLGQFHEWTVSMKSILLYYVFGPSYFLSEAFTIITNASLCIAIYLICRHMGTTRLSARGAVAFNAFLPSLVFWSTQDTKDPVLAACAAWSLLAFLKTLQLGAGSAYLLLLVLMDLLALIYRPYAGILLTTGLLMATVYAIKLPPTLPAKMARVWLFVLLTPLVVWLGTKEMKASYGEGMGVQWAVDSYQTFSEGKIAGDVQGSQYEIPLSASTPGRAVLQLPIRILLLLLTPLPFFPGTLRRMLMFPEMWFLYLYVVPRFVKGLRAAWSGNRMGTAAVLLSVGPWVLAQALKTALSGEAVRMRSQFLPELLIFAGVGYAVMEQRKQARQDVADRGAWLWPRW